MNKSLHLDKFIMLLILPILLSGCDNFGSKKIKTIVELSPRVSASNNTSIILHDQLGEIDANDITKFESYKLSTNKIISKPLFAKGVLYAIDSKANVYAYKVSDRKLLWKSNFGNKSTYGLNGGGIALAHNRLYVTNGTRNVIILDPLTGTEILRKEFADIIRTKPVILQENIILVQTISNQTYAFNVDDSKLLWQHEAPFETLTSTSHVSPIVINDQILINYSSGFMVSLKYNGEENWVISLNEERDIGLPNYEQATLSCDPAIDKDHIYVAIDNGKLAKININSGQIIWKLKINDVQSMSLNGDNLILANNAKQLVIINTQSGNITYALDIQPQNKKNNKIISFLQPVVSKKNDQFSINIVSNNSTIYSFMQNPDGSLSTKTNIHKIKNGISFVGKTCCGKVYLLTDKSILLQNEVKGRNNLLNNIKKFNPISRFRNS